MEDKSVWVVETDFYSDWRERENMINGIKKRHKKARISVDGEQNMVIYQYKKRENESVFN